jgi:hypothetical protein
LTLVGGLISLIRHRPGKYCTDRDGKLPVEGKTLIQINALSCSREQPLKATVPRWRPGHAVSNNPWGQMGLLTAVVIVRIVMAAHYVW